jgi:drug/metabolite transporter (DMT)-like permease
MSHPLALAAVSIALWASLAAIGARLSHLPPFLLVGLGLGFGCLPGLARARDWFPSLRVLLFGVGGLFGYHFLLFLSFRLAPALEANLLNYLWPIGIVLLSALLLPGHRIGARHLVGGALAFAGAALVLVGQSDRQEPGDASVSAWLGYTLALGAAATWAGYSVLTKRLGGVPTSAVGGFCALSSLLALACHAALEPAAVIAPGDWPWIACLGIGPMGIAFYAWDAALKRGDPRVIGTLSYFTPLLSTGLLSLASGRALGWRSGAALALISLGAVVGTPRSSREK